MAAGPDTDTTDGPAISGRLLSELESLFEDARGRENAVTSADIADRLAISDSAAQPKTREAIRILLEERNLPIAAGHSGYYILETEDEFRDYMSTLGARINGIRERQQMVASAWYRHKSRAQERRERALRNEALTELSEIEVPD